MSVCVCVTQTCPAPSSEGLSGGVDTKPFRFMHDVFVSLLCFILFLRFPVLSHLFVMA